MKARCCLGKFDRALARLRALPLPCLTPSEMLRK